MSGEQHGFFSLRKVKMLGQIKSVCATEQNILGLFFLRNGIALYFAECCCRGCDKNCPWM